MLLHKLYYDPATGLQGADKLYVKAKALDPTIKKKEVVAFLKKQETNQVHTAPKPLKHFYPIKSSYQDHIWQADLMDVSALAHSNSGINYFLCVIDIWSRYAWVVMLKNKTNTTCVEAFQQILKKGRTPKILMSDNGSEFVSRNWKRLMTQYKIEQSFAEPGDHHRMGIVERFNKTIRGVLTKYMTAYKTKRYVDVVEKLVESYNNTVHSSTGSTSTNPDPKKIASILEEKERKAQAVHQTFEIGDQVRSLKNKKTFEKGAQAKYSSTVHKVVVAEGKRYKLDNDKWYLYYQLLPVKELETFEAPEPARSASPEREPKKIRIALKQEGVEKRNIREGLRERKPKAMVVSSEGERIHWS